MKTLRAMLIGFVALVALMAIACGDSEDTTVVEPTPEPTVAQTPTPEPTPTPTPEPPTPATGTAGTQTDTTGMTFTVPEFSADVTGKDIVEVMFSEDEQSCIREAIGDDAYAMLLESNPLGPAAQGTTTIFGECLSQETSVTLFLAGFQVVAGGAISDASMTCVGNAVAPHHAVLSAAELDPAVEFGFLPCLTPEEMAALQALAPQ